MFSTHFENFLQFSSNLKLSSANSSVWRHLKFVVWDRVKAGIRLELQFNSLPDDKILDLSKLKTFADDKINIEGKLKFGLGKGENIVVKGENAGYQHFLPFPHFVHKASIGPTGVAQWCATHDLVVEVKFLSGIFPPLTSAEAGEKSSQWLWEEICVSTDVRKPGNTYASPAAMI